MDNWTAPKSYYNNIIFAGCNLVVKFDCKVLQGNFNHKANCFTRTIKKILTKQILFFFKNNPNHLFRHK